MCKRHTRPGGFAKTLAALLLLASLLPSAYGASRSLSTKTMTPTTRTPTPRVQREHLTPEEIELVRDNQELDKRTSVFIKAAERRLLVANNPQSAAAKLSAKDLEKWGELKGTRAELLSDLARILDEAITNIDDAAQHNEKSSLVPKSLRMLADACNRFAPQLASMRDAAQDDAEREWIEKAVENAQEVIEAAGKLAHDAKK